MRWGRAALVLFATVLSGFAVVRDPGVLQPIKWAAPTAALTLQQDGSDDITDGSDLQAIRDGMAAWTAVACSNWTFTEAGTSASRAVADDGVNRVTFTESGWPGGASGAAALTTWYRDTTPNPDTFREADIQLNGQDFCWGTRGDLDCIDIQSTVTHELGHALGLSHSADPRATMFALTAVGAVWSRNLYADDQNALCYLYPSGAFTCGSDADCPAFYNYYGGSTARLHCSSGSCSQGAAAYGADCYAAADCVSGLCQVDPDALNPNDPGFCTQTCSTASQNCPAGDFCADFGSGPECWLGRDNCVAAASRTVCQGLLGSNGYCIQDLDGMLRCRRTCLRDSNCAGEICYGGTGAPPPGFCRPLGVTALGQPCTDGLECDELTCAGAGVQPTCSAWPWPRNDGGTPDAGPSDGGADGAPGDTTSGDTADGGPPGGDDTEPADTITGGCACSAAAMPVLLSALLALAALRRRA